MSAEEDITSLHKRVDTLEASLRADLMRCEAEHAQVKEHHKRQDDATNNLASAILLFSEVITKLHISVQKLIDQDIADRPAIKLVEKSQLIWTVGFKTAVVVSAISLFALTVLQILEKVGVL